MAMVKQRFIKFKQSVFQVQQGSILFDLYIY